MQTKKSKKDILEALISYYGNGKPSVFAKLLGVAPSTISSWLSRSTLDYDLIFAKCEMISAHWLLTGEGDMIISQNTKSINPAADEALGRVSDNPRRGVPLIPIDAMAGFLNGEVSADEHDCERVLIPGIKADYVVTVRGNSMEPHYFSGDLVACQVLPLSDIFFQWGKAYVINTSSGVLLKKIKPGSTNATVLLVSENPDFDPFEMPRANIYHVALVTALVRLI
jgi:phage repressor protein C with HTH and peptisase S24 domain